MVPPTHLKTFEPQMPLQISACLSSHHSQAQLQLKHSLQIILARAFIRTTRAILCTPKLQSANAIRTHTGTTARATNNTISPLHMITRPPKSLLIAELLATIGTLAVAGEDVVTMGWKGANIFGKTNGGGVVLSSFGRHLAVKKEDGKWKFSWERNS